MGAACRVRRDAQHPRDGGTRMAAHAGGGRQRAAASEAAACEAVCAGQHARGGSMREVKVEIAKVYVPMARRKTLDAARVEALAEDILENGQKAPILVRPDTDRLVLVEGLHRLEACRALGDDTVLALMVQARKA